MFGRKKKRIEELEAKCLSYERALQESCDYNIHLRTKLNAYQRAIAISLHNHYSFGSTRIQRVLDDAEKSVIHAMRVHYNGDPVIESNLVLDTYKDTLEGFDLLDLEFYNF